MTKIKFYIIILFMNESSFKPENEPTEIFDAFSGNIYGFATTTGLSMISFVPPYMTVLGKDDEKLREFDILFLQDFFDHAGNLHDGALISYSTVLAASIASYIKNKSLFMRKGAAKVTAFASTLFATAANYAHEVGLPIPVLGLDSGETTGDLTDAAYGSVGGALVSLAFYYGAKGTIVYENSE